MMRNWRIAIGLALGLALGSGGLIWAQNTIIPTTMSGNETWTVALGGPQGPSAFMSAFELQSATGYTLQGVASSGNVILTQAKPVLLINIQPNGTLTIFSPPLPIFDGTIAKVCNTSTANFSGQTITFQQSAGQVFANGTLTLTTMAKQTCVAEVWNLASGNWVQMQ